MRWDWLPWRRTAKARARILAAAEAAQETERQAARRRFLEAARHNERPGWNAPTTHLTPPPLLTRGQEARTRQPGRW